MLKGENGQKIVMALVVLAGGSNLWQGHSNEKETREDLEKAVKEIHDINAGYMKALDKQQGMVDALKRIEDQTKKGTQ
ncbi:MAG TPA: hypothetical protein VNZ45_01670 [Bacteroidia bacterium]|nr:hypothetical protein [Bacteroidia bacterium]